jgi:enoyl-CoA hydratase
VISQISSASKQACIIVFFARRARYSGSERPAWRMNHTGTWLASRPDAAARYGDFGRSRRVFIGDHAAMSYQFGAPAPSPGVIS